VRAAVLGASVIAYMGIMKVNLTGPGLTETVRALWRKPKPAAAAAAAEAK
jgi:succinate dehydrogenase (ubiquinone) membrane anchor subunit